MVGMGSSNAMDPVQMQRLRGASIVLRSPPADTVSLLQDLLATALSAESELAAWVPPELQQALRESVAKIQSGAAPLSRSTLHPIVATLEARYRTIMSDFRLSHQYAMLMRG